jgi:hypothetical protein
MTKMIRNPFAVVLVCASALSLVPVQSSAQDQGANPLMVKHRNDCRLAAQVLIIGEPHTKRDWARGYIANCEDEGPSAIVQEWRRVPADTAAVVQLMRASTAIRDMRIYEQVRSVAVDRSRADVVRVGAMHVLDSYVDPHHAGWFESRPPADRQVRRVYPANAVLAHAAYTNGPARLVGSVREPVLQLLQQIAAARQVEPVTVWYAAAALAKRLEYQRGR